MLKFKQPKEYIDGTIKYTSINASNGIVDIYKYRDNTFETLIEFFGDNPQEIGGTNYFKKEFFNDFETAKNWAETQICQVVKIKVNKIKKSA